MQQLPMPQGCQKHDMDLEGRVCNMMLKYVKILLKYLPLLLRCGFGRGFAALLRPCWLDHRMGLLPQDTFCRPLLGRR